MIGRFAYKRAFAWRIRIKNALRCLFYPHFVVVFWKRCDDGDLDFRIAHKGCPAKDAVYRLSVDALEILQNVVDEEDALEEAQRLIDGK